MKVRELIKELKKMPKDLEVFTAMHDNSEEETAGYTHSVSHVVKSDYPDCDENEDMPDEWVTIRS